MTVLALFFSRTRIGRALRAVADDHQAALAVGIPLQQIWAIVWAVAGFVALVAGLLWGARNGVQFALTFVALKALPVLILGGFESIPGAIVGGLIIGATEKLAEVYLGPYRRRRHRRLVPVRAGAALPAGPARRPVRREDHSTASDRGVTDRCSIAKPASSRRPTQTDQQIFPIRQDRIAIAAIARRRVRRRAARRDAVLVHRHPDPVPDPLARRARAQHPHRLRRAALARHRGVHGGGRVRGVQLHAARARHADPASRSRCGGVVRRARRHRCSACRACASAASISRWRRSPRSSSSSGS